MPALDHPGCRKKIFCHWSSSFGMSGASTSFLRKPEPSWDVEVKSKAKQKTQNNIWSRKQRIELKWNRNDIDVTPRCLPYTRIENIALEFQLSSFSSFELHMKYTLPTATNSTRNETHVDSSMHKKHAKQHNEQTRIAQSFKRKETNRLITRNLTHWRQTTQNNKMKHHLIMSSSWLLLKAFGYWFLEF